MSHARDCSRIEVVAGAIVRGERLLLTQRTDGAPGAWLWECPGGKVEQGELHEDALRRELFEELGVDAVVGDVLCGVTCDPPVTTYPIRVTFFRVEVTGEPCSLVAAGFGWFNLGEVVALPQTPANELALAVIRRLLQDQRLERIAPR